MVPSPRSDGVSQATWIVHCDGSAVPNPGRMAYGAVIVSPDGERHTLSFAGTDVGCNNEAELLGVMAALRESSRLGARQVLLHSDNRTLVDQLGGGAPPIARLADLFDQARGLMETLDGVRLLWIPRHRNAEADALARAALGLPGKTSLPAGRVLKRRLSKARQKSE